MIDLRNTQTAFRRNLKAARPDGFTLIELLVVVATVGMLAMVLLPALAATKPDSQSFQCLENQRQLVRAWQMYAEDNNDLLPPNDYPYTTAYTTAAPAAQASMKNWVVGTMIQPLDSADALAGIGKSYLLDPNTLLSPYQTNRAVYRCPADNYVNPYTHRVNVRSYSMNLAVGTLWNSSSTYAGGSSAPVLGSSVSGGWLPGISYNASQTIWLTYGKMSSFSRPGPANTFVIMDESAQSINDGRMEVSAEAAPGSTYLIDFPSGNHNAAAAISFVDGHVIIHKWQDARTYTAVFQVGGIGFGGPFPPAPDDQDCFYLAPITSARR